MFTHLQNINHKPEPFEFISTQTLWNDPHISKQMLAFHLNNNLDLASRNRKFIDLSVEWINARFKVGQGINICDFGCGPGLYTQRFAEKGAFVTGLDFSERSLDYAIKTAAANRLSIRYLLQNYLEFETDEQFDLITMIMCDFCALSEAQRKILLKKFFHLLKDDGAILLDVHSHNYYFSKKEEVVFEHGLMNGFWSENDYYGFMNSFVYPEEKILLDKYTIVEKSHIWQVYNWLQCFSPASLINELNAYGFNAIEILGDLKGSPYTEGLQEFAVVIRKNI